MLALIGDEDEAGYLTVKGTARLDEESGANYFERSDTGIHSFVVKKFSDEYYKKQINDLL
jgi:hypothetical protein